MNFLLELLWRAPITVVTAVLSSVVSFGVYLWLQHSWQQRLRRRLQTSLNVYEVVHGQREVALVLSVVTDIHQAAAGHLEKQGRRDIQVFQVHQAIGFRAGEEDWASYLELVKAEAGKIKELAPSRVFLFANIPVALAVLVGAALIHGPEIVVHHFDAGAYYPIGRITVAAIRL